MWLPTERYQQSDISINPVKCPYLSWFSIPMFQWFLLAIHRWMDPVTQQPYEASRTRIFLNSVSSAKPFINYFPMKNISQLGTCRFFLQPILGIYTMYIYNLVGGIPTPLKNMKVGWDDYSQNMDKYNMFQTTTKIYIYIYDSFL